MQRPLPLGEGTDDDRGISGRKRARGRRGRSLEVVIDLTLQRLILNEAIRYTDKQLISSGRVTGDIGSHRSARTLLDLIAPSCGQAENPY